MILHSSTAKLSSYRQASKNIVNNIMCKAIDDSSNNKDLTRIDQQGSSSSYISHSAAMIPSFVSNNLRLLKQPPYTLRKIFLLLFLASIFSFVSLYTFHRGFRRTIQFWRGMIPFITKYKWVKFKATKIDHCSPEELEARLNMFRDESAPQLVDLIIRMGGIYVKIGQVFSTIGQGLLPQQYVDALKPLQDGLPPRSKDEISNIIQQSTGKSMDELFISFDEVPVGAASVAQVHRATLRPQIEGDAPQQIVLKVQYPEVGELFDADLSNLELATRLFAPENVDVVKAMRKRHENELDFRLEARNMRECTRDMQKYGVEPSLVRIPRVVDAICTKNVLAMEYLDGLSLSDAIEEEQNRVAKALGKRDGEELKNILASRMKDHFENGGGAGSGGMQIMLGKSSSILGSSVVQSAASSLLRSYASVRDSLEDVAIHVAKYGTRLRTGWKGDIMNALPPYLHTPAEDSLAIVADNKSMVKKRKVKVNLGRALKTLVHVHGLQLMISGVYNADPHPGNVLILPDGRLGLLDYGLVGRLSTKDRETVAKIIIALSENDKSATAKIYREQGYTATFKDSDSLDDAMLHRFASFHLDRIDLSPLTLDNGEKIEIMEMLQSTRERAVPSFVEEGRRLGGLLMGVNAQAARPISLSKEWRPIAKQALRESK